MYQCVPSTELDYQSQNKFITFGDIDGYGY